jgi:hypothetical protein
MFDTITRVADRALRVIAPSFVADGASGVSIRTRLKGMTDCDEQVLRLVGAHLGSLASRDLKIRCGDGLEHSSRRWADRKRELTAESSSRWAGAITKASQDQWALARRSQAAYVRSLETGILMIERRLALPIGSPGSRRAPGGYRCRLEWHGKSRRLRVLRDRLAAARADREAGLVRITWGGRRLLSTRHNLTKAGLAQSQWRERWEAERWFLQADGEAGKRWGNETIRVTPDGEVSIRLPEPLTHLANARYGRYVLAAGAVFAHRGHEWAQHVEAKRAVAYRIHYDTGRRRWYLTASWQRQSFTPMPLSVVRAGGVVGVDTNGDHFAAWRLDPHGNPVGAPRRFGYDLSGDAEHRDAQVRHALTRLLHWTCRSGAPAIAVENLDFAGLAVREKHGCKPLRRLASRFPTRKLRARLVTMAAAHAVAVVAVDPAYTSKWGVQHWKRPLTTPARQVSPHDVASIAIGRRALGHPIRRRTAPPRDDQSDRHGHRAAQAGPDAGWRKETRRHPLGSDAGRLPPGRAANAGNQDIHHRSGCPAEQGAHLSVSGNG